MFKKAEKKKSKLRLALTGPSGSGKTFSALKIATGIANKIDSRIAFIDTEKGSASLYADRFDFDVIELDAPYQIDDYIKSIKSAEENGYQVLIIDSTTHGWNFILEYVEKLTVSKYKGNSFRAWSEGTPLYNKWINAMLDFKGHIIVTMRAKTEYVLSNENGKSKVEKVGMGTENRRGIEYEFTSVGEGDLTHNFLFTKDRTGLLQDKIITPDESLGTELIEWLEQGIDMEAKEKEDLEVALIELEKVESKEQLIDLLIIYDNLKKNKEFLEAIKPYKEKFKEKKGA